ncbi:uncharacterized protein [Anabrus simplex]|uniref:uncharacterized protein n=1 Tax=Anabrus simplex TaxID=316456 RepID=UPI0034DD2446
MIGPTTDNTSTDEKLCNNKTGPRNTTVQTRARAVKRKLLADTKNRERKCYLRGNKSVNSNHSSNLEVVVVNGKWNINNHSLSECGEMHNTSLHISENANNSATWSDTSGSNFNDGEKNGNRQFFSDYSEIDSGVGAANVNVSSSPVLENSGHQQVSDYDNEASNLSWLLNFKVDSLFNSNGFVHDHNYQGSEEEDESRDGTTEARIKSAVNRSYLSDSNDNVEKFQAQMKIYKASPYTSKKPPFTYTELIEQALHERGELTVSGIYSWISERFPFYKANDDRWKNSVRHNLSINPHFRKGSKAHQGAGHLWRVANKDAQSRYSVRKQQRITQFISDMVTLDELQAATASIEENKENRAILEDMDTCESPQSIHEVEGSQHLQEESVQPSETYIPEVFSPNDGVSLEQSAEEILSGVKKEVEVQYLIPIQQKTTIRTDFLNPVSKDIVVQESGLLDKGGDLEGSFLITDLHPTGLSLNINDTEIVTPENLFPDEISFQYYEFTSQSAQVQV